MPTVYGIQRGKQMLTNWSEFEWSMLLVADVLYIGGFFPIYYAFFPVIHCWSFLHQSSIFRVVDVLRAVSYTVAEDEWIFSSLLWIFSCVLWSTLCTVASIKRATKWIPEQCNQSYRERLKVLNLPSLKYWCWWYSGDMIELFKMIKGIYHSACVPHVDVIELSEDLIGTRGNNFKLIQHHCHHDLRKFNFTKVK